MIKCANNCDNKEILYNDLNTHYTFECPKINFKDKYAQLIERHNKVLEDCGYYEGEETYAVELSKPEMFFKSNSHKHKLMRCATALRINWACNKCGDIHDAIDESYYCAKCDFDLCPNCVNEEKEVG